AGAGVCAVTPAEMASASAVVMNLEFMPRLLAIQTKAKLWQPDFAEARALSHLFHAFQRARQPTLFDSADRRMFVFHAVRVSMMPSPALLRIRVFVAALAALSALAGAWPSAHAQPAAAELAGPALLATLRGGGYILFFRHAATDFGQNDDNMTGYEDCSTQRNLTDKGRAEARAIGTELRALA